MQALIFLIFAVEAFSAVVKPVEHLRIIEQCAERTKTERAEYENPKGMFLEPSENFLCMSKCVLEDLKITDADGKIRLDSLDDYLYNAPNELRDKMLECGVKIKMIKVCEDIRTFRECILPVVVKLYDRFNKL